MRETIKVEVDNLLSPEECAELIMLGETNGFEDPTIKTPDGEMVDKSFRNNGRYIFENEEYSSKLFDRFKDLLPQRIEDWKLKDLNSQMKIYKYSEGQHFRMHRDVPYIRENKDRSFLTMLIYLNEEFEGETFFLLDGSVAPVTGKGLIFQQNVKHAGVEVTKGVKYALRTDVMYERSMV